ncbi:MAG: hypothetical protein EXR58_06155 [Chloroflexi bacterium]|nr:hypothetical protein [Chloroflexota bacterium]
MTDSVHKRARSLLRIVKSVALASLLAVACVPAGQSPAAKDSAVSTRTSPKTLTMGFARADTTVITSFGRHGGGGTTAGSERWLIFHSSLSSVDQNYNVIPLVAQKVPSIQDGDWIVNADQTMELTWKLRPDVYWHDGAPVTAHDFVFGYEVAIDPALAVPDRDALRLVSSVQATDDHTLVVKWKAPSLTAHIQILDGVTAIARHQVEPLYRTLSPEAFTASRVWGAEYLGLGPYRVTAFEPGIQLVAEAFDRYFLGRPKIDVLNLISSTDVNVVTARVLAGDIDVVSAGMAIRPDQMKEIARAWGSSGGTVINSPVDIRALFLSLKVAGVPWQNQRFRQAMLASIDRQEIVDVLHQGYTEVSQYLALRAQPIYPMLQQQRVPSWDYDPRRGQQLFEEAGWGTINGVLHNKATGEKVPTFYCCNAAQVDVNNTQESLTWGHLLEQAGMEIVHPIPSPPAGLRAADQRSWVFHNEQEGGRVANYVVRFPSHYLTLHTQAIPSEENAWVGDNRAGWSNPRFDGLATRWSNAIDITPQRQLEVQMQEMLMDQLPLFPMYPGPLGLVFSKRIVGPMAGNIYTRGNTGNIHAWEAIGS